MKKITLALVALMLVLGMTQCKKEQQPNNTTSDEGETVFITMKVADNGDKHIVYPSTGAVVYSDGDVIYVGNNGKYVGKLTYANGAFSGSITNPSTSDYLHFYFTGGKTPSTNPTAGSTTSFTVDISDQSSKLPVLSYGHSTSKYIDGTTAYTCMLENKCGLVKFVPVSATSNSISVSGMKNTANINFATPGITPTNATGSVTLYSVSDTEKWAILLPQNALTNVNVTIANYLSTIASVPAVTINMYYNTGVDISMIDVPTGAISGLFTINSNGDKVWFSQGNLQWRATNNSSNPLALNEWRFAEHQYDYVGDNNKYVSMTNPGWIDLFGWGTSGWESGAECYMPYEANPYGEKYRPGGDYANDLTGAYANADWGVYNAISNGGNQSGMWRTLTFEEWCYIFSSRTNATLKYGYAKINYKNGVILLPDDWTLPNGLSFNNSTSQTMNTYSTSQWAKMEANGAVFLPAAGYRQGVQTSNMMHNVGEYGYYWSSSHPNDLSGLNINFANAIHIYATACQVGFNSDGWSRSNGYSVRLVKDVN